MGFSCILMLNHHYFVRKQILLFVVLRSLAVSGFSVFFFFLFNSDCMVARKTNISPHPMNFLSSNEEIGFWICQNGKIP